MRKNLTRVKFMVGVSLILVGAWVFVAALSPSSSGLGRGWVGLLIPISLPILVLYLGQGHKQSGLLFIAMTLFLGSILLGLFTFQVGGFGWGTIGRYWPAFFLVSGGAFLIMYLADDMRQPILLIPVYALGGGGLILLILTTGILATDLISQLIQLWPIPIALLILILIFRPSSQPAQTISSD